MGLGAISRWGVHRHAMAVQEAATALQRYRNILLSGIYQPPDEPRTRPPANAAEEELCLQWALGFEEQVWTVAQQASEHVHNQERSHVDERRREEDRVRGMEELMALVREWQHAVRPQYGPAAGTGVRVAARLLRRARVGPMLDPPLTEREGPAHRGRPMHLEVHHVDQPSTTGLTPSAHTQRVLDLVSGKLGVRGASLGRTEMPSDEDAEAACSHDGEEPAGTNDPDVAEPPEGPDDASPSSDSMTTCSGWPGLFDGVYGASR